MAVVYDEPDRRTLGLHQAISGHRCLIIVRVCASAYLWPSLISADQYTCMAIHTALPRTCRQTSTGQGLELHGLHLNHSYEGIQG